MRKDNWHKDQDDFKTSILKMYQQPNRNILETKKKREFPPRRSYTKEPNENYRTEKYNKFLKTHCVDAIVEWRWQDRISELEDKLNLHWLNTENRLKKEWTESQGHVGQ